MKALFLAFLVPVSAIAAPRLKAPDFSLRATKAGRTISVVAHAPAGNHFNTAAPMSPKPVKAGEKETRFSLPGDTRQFEISIYLCDDAKTYCEKHVVKAEWDPALKALKQQGAASGASESSHRVKTGEHLGFILNDPEKAFALAKERNEPLLIDFYGIWCPPCNEYDEHVFGTAAFRKATGHLIKLKLDVDSGVSAKWLSKYRIQGYPTLIFASADGEEFGRVVGYRKTELLVREIATAFQQRDATESLLAKRAEQGDREAADRLGMRCYDRAEWDRASKYLAGTSKHREELLASEFELLKAKNAPNAEQISALEKTVHEFPDSPESIDRRISLADLYDQDKRAEDKKRILLAAIEKGEKLAGSPAALEGHDYTKPDVIGLIASAYEELGEKEQAKGAWSRAVREYRSMRKSETERGYGLELAYSLWKSSDVAGATNVYARLEKAFPSEFTFHYAHASMLLKLNRGAEAEPQARAAYENSYGNNRIRSALLLAKVLKAKGSVPEARAVIKKTIGETPVPEDTSLSTYRLLDSLKKFEREIAT